MLLQFKNELFQKSYTRCFVSVWTLNSFRLPVLEANICFVLFCHPFVCKIFYIMQWENNYIMQASLGYYCWPKYPIIQRGNL